MSITYARTNGNGSVDTYSTRLVNDAFVSTTNCRSCRSGVVYTDSKTSHACTACDGTGQTAVTYPATYELVNDFTGRVSQTGSIDQHDAFLVPAGFTKTETTDTDTAEENATMTTYTVTVYRMGTKQNIDIDAQTFEARKAQQGAEWKTTVNGNVTTHEYRDIPGRVTNRDYVITVTAPEENATMEATTVATERCACGTPLLYADETDRGTCPECHFKANRLDERDGLIRELVRFHYIDDTKARTLYGQTYVEVNAYYRSVAY